MGTCWPAGQGVPVMQYGLWPNEPALHQGYNHTSVNFDPLMASKADVAATLFNFTRLSPTEPFSILQKLLWPTGDRPSGPLCMDPSVAPYVQSYTTNSEHSSTIDYNWRNIWAYELIDWPHWTLSSTRDWRVHNHVPPLQLCAHTHKVLGKSVGASYLLLHLLACGQPVFFVPEPQVIYYFSKSGVQVSREPYESYYMGDGPTEDAVPESWVLLDVDAVQHPEWFPSFKLWVGLGVGLVYTALLDAGGKHWFTKQFVTDTRNVQPLSQEEMAALGHLRLGRESTSVRPSPVHKRVGSGDIAIQTGGHGRDYVHVHDALWPQHGATNRLAPYILSDRIDMNRVWTDDVAMPEDEHPLFNYIDLDRIPVLKVHKAEFAGKLIIREEYENFITDSLAWGEGYRRFLTGQPGIGKSVGAAYFLFYLIAMGHPVFFVPHPEVVYYFSSSVVQMLLGNPVPRINTAEAEAALNASWVLIDTDQPSDWIPGIWVKNGKITVWTAFPAQHRMDHYKKQIEAKTWVMKSWSMDEVAAYMFVSYLHGSIMLTPRGRHP
ncbi:hypothetical protein FB45DRAFT_881720 [Roridomyces roridus]|uniref:Uncharacterized protein n=1 Tax=Roridomyces roridus TaxID=1738132 RepID=A0AAD7AXL3_9AGAR|nr:hypothetical protein FB45DRAFT_881720 [Roridomyces roridus]